ncbi:MAG TPA: hypothetical protein VGL89_04630 [Candidatus Koribacter sp.]|jgi:hypothetical protein
MNFEELDELLPAGLHDTEVLRVEEHFQERRVRMLVEFWWPTGEEIEGWKRAWLTLEGIQRWVWEFCSVYEDSWGGPLSIDGGKADPELLEKHADIYRDLEGELLKGWMFVSNWNAYLYWAGTSISVEFTD